MIIIWLIIAILVYFYVNFRISRRHIEVCGDKIPGDKALPIIGNIWTYRKAKSSTDLVNLIIKTGKKYIEHGIFRLWAGQFLVVGVYDPKYIEIISNSPNGARKGIIYPIVFAGFPKGVFITNDTTKWRELRKPLTKTLNRKNMDNEYHQTFVNHNKKFIDYLRENKCGKEVDIHLEINNLTLDIFSETLLGISTNEVRDSKFDFLQYGVKYIEHSISVKTIAKMSNVFGIQQMARTFLTDKELEENKMGLQKFLHWALVERMKKLPNQIKGNLIYYTDFLLRRQKEKNLSGDRIERELLDIAFAGTDTSSVLSSSVLLFLAMFPEIQEEVYKEQMSIFEGNSMKEPSPADLHSMEYLTRVIKETLRFCCPGVILKQASGDIQLDKYIIPKDTIIIMIIDLLCQDERYWEKPKIFYPDHFLPEKEAERPYHAFPAFGCGPRICPGIHYGFRAVKVTLSFIIRNFKLSTRTKFEDIDVEHQIMRSFKSFKITLEER